ncbi:ABC transporter permease [Rhodanobacter sp. 115]|uniref:ABC transporter permease n=1 Tax=Rhodanobacter sp. FW021-MT20 TaxID=1162282 RepID=UPI000260DBAA|nr:ABC transporter permease subunit [Rhodanobacter sp. 115]EIL86869.1 multi-copper enzyme maturation ABC transporter permease [Rhodanobacter sp. 115]
MSRIAIIAGKEFRDDFRNRWTIAVAMLFTVLALGIAYFGGAAAGKVGFTSFDATLASLTTLAAFVVPLIGLLIAYDMVVGEQDNGTLLLVLSYPISRIELVAGKFLGHCAALATAILAGFGVAVVIIQVMQPEARTMAAWLSIGNFVLSASMLGASFVALASVISVTTTDKARAAGLALVAWLLTVIIFDLCLLAILVFSGGNPWEQSAFPCLLYLNPIDVFRLINLTMLGSGGGNELFMGMTATHVYRPWVLYLAMLLWVIVPFALAQFLFRRKEI